MSVKCDISESMRHLRRLRDDLCEKEKIWKEAYKARDYVVSELKENYKLLKQQKIEECQSRLEVVFDTLDESAD